MKKRICFALALLLTISYVFSGCSLFDNGKGKTLYYPVYSDTDSFDPQIASGEASRIVAKNCFEGLVKYDEQGKIVPGVASSYTVSDDGLTYTFSIDRSAKWYMSKDSEEILRGYTKSDFNYSVTADDFVFGLKRYFDPGTKASPDSLLYTIKNAQQVASGSASLSELGVKALDEYTLEITLSAPGDSFLGALTKSSAMPCREEFFLASKGRYGLAPKYLICNGPFFLAEHSEDTYIEMDKNENYKNKDKVCPASVYLYINGDNETRLTKLENGTYDACPVNVTEKQKLGGNISFVSYNNRIWSFCFNCSDKYFINSDLRLAICQSTDIASIELPEYSTGYAKGFIPSVCKAGEKDYRRTAGSAPSPAFSRQSAVQHYKSALKKLDVDEISATLICPRDLENQMRKTVQMWQKNLGVSFTVSIEPLDEEELEERVESGEYDIAFAGVTTRQDSAAGFLNTFTQSGEYQVFSFTSITFSELVENAVSAVNSDDIAKKCFAAESFMLSSGAVYPVFSENSFLALAKNVSGVYLTQAGTIPVFEGGLRID